MRVGLDLRGLPADHCVAAAIEADRVGLWAVLINDDAASVAVLAAQLATQTEHVHLGLALGDHPVHPLTLAEEISVVDNLSQRRVLAVDDSQMTNREVVEQLLLGHTVDEMTLAPPPAQSMLRIYQLGVDIQATALTSDLVQDRATIDRHRNDGTTHLFVQWPGPMLTLARHLVSRAATPDFPQIVADHADVIAP